MDLALRPFGARVLTAREERALARRCERMVEQLVAVYEERVSPDLKPRARRLDR